MLIIRTPLRISIGGGGTDLPSYYEQFGGFVLSAAIDKYVFIGINRIFTDDYVLKYSELERVKRIEEIRHPILRAALALNGIEPYIEIVSLADIPAGTGLGSSGSFTVGLVRALHALKREPVSPAEVAEEACHIEIDMLRQAVGKQDQYVASYGGLLCLELAPGGAVQVSPLRLPNGTLGRLQDHLLMFFTGYSRSAPGILADQNARTQSSDRQMLENLHYTKCLGFEIKCAIEGGDLARFGGLMHEHWIHKRERSNGMSNPCIDHWYEVGRANSALGGKLIGAGGGGFLLFFAEDGDRLRKAMAAEGLEEVRFKFDHDGSTVLMRD